MIENIRLVNPNVTRDGGYFYSFDEETDAMVQKTDDGTLAFAYPLDTPVSSEITSLEFDGESFWTMEDIDGTPANGFKIKRWVIENFVMVLQQTFLFDTDATDTFESLAFAIERYATDSASGNAGTTSLIVNYDTDIYNLITPGTNLFLGPNSLGESERVTVATPGPAGNELTLSANLTNSYSADDVIFSKNIWFFNEHYLKTADVGALYKASISDGSISSRTQGGAYLGINAAGFVDLENPTAIFTGALAVHNKQFLVFIRTNSLLFVDVNDANLTTELSAIQNNLNADTTTVYPVFDMAIDRPTIFRLQTKFNINGTETDSGSIYNYQLATFTPFPTAIALVADPALLPADAGSSNSTITATVTDQYLLPFISGATIQFDFSGGGGDGVLSDTNPITLNTTTGQASVVYTSGSAAGLVTITAEVQLT